MSDQNELLDEKTVAQLQPLSKLRYFTVPCCCVENDQIVVVIIID